MSELDNRQDIIMMIFSTQEGEEFISYVVNPETKTIESEFSKEAATQLGGTFSNFFSWNKE